MLFSKLNKLKNNLLYFVSIESLIYTTVLWLKNYKEEKEADEFMKYITEIDKALELDLLACSDFIELIGIICGKNVNFKALN